MRREHFIYLALALITAAVFWPVSRCGFIYCDDLTSVAENPHIQQGLTLAGVAWAFRAVVVSNWQPVTCLSQMLDCQLFGNSAAAHHLVNLLFHCANAVLLFHVLRRMTGELWPSAVVAALFAWHPLHVESVAWISERKDVLSAFFGLLTIGAYSNYAGLENQETKGKGRHYLLAIFFYALGLMSKPMLVTWPFVLLLLDFWPLERVSGFEFQQAGRRLPGSQRLTPGRLVLEKLPFFALAIVSSVITFQIQHNSGAMRSIRDVAIPHRIDNALISYVRYLGKTIWPDHLAIIYPHPGSWPAWQVISAAALLALITSGVVWQARRRPFLVFGWLWFMGTLVPVIGLVQVGNQAMADRYSYLPLIGVFVMMVWGVNDFAGQWPPVKLWFPGVAATGLAACLVGTRLQLRFWEGNEALFLHALDVTTNNVAAQFILGSAMVDGGKTAEGLAHLDEALELQPDLVEIRCKVAETLARDGHAREAVHHYYEALRYQPDLPEALNNLAWILATDEDPGIRNGVEAVKLAERACSKTRSEKTIYIGTLAAAYAEAGRYEDAVRTAEKACASAIALNEKELAARNRRLLEFYRAGRPYHEKTGSSL